MLISQASILLKVIRPDSQVLTQVDLNCAILGQLLDTPHMSPHRKRFLCEMLPSMIGDTIRIPRAYHNLSPAGEPRMHLPEEHRLDMTHRPHSLGMDICANLYVKSAAGDESVNGCMKALP